jgi:hypothetical protein
MRDLLNGLVSKLAKAAAAISTNTTTNGLVIDLQGFDSCRFDIASATLTDGTYAVSIQEGTASDGSDMADAPASSVLGSVSFAAADDNTVKSLSYVGSKRYARIKIVSTGVTTGGTLGATAVLARQRHTGGKAV